MLAASTVLRQHRWPATPVGPDDDPSSMSASETDADTAHRDELRNRASRFGDDFRLVLVQENPHDIGSWHATDASIAEIETEQVRVRGVLVLVEGFEPPLGRF